MFLLSGKLILSPSVTAAIMRAAIKKIFCCRLNSRRAIESHMNTKCNFSNGSGVAATLRVLVFTGLTLVMVPIHLVYGLLVPDEPFRIPQLYHRFLLRLFGMRVRVHGAMAPTQPILFVANHTSYLDILVLNALIPAAFVAKAEVAGWPLIGLLAKLQHTVFIERRASRAGDQRDILARHLEKGQSLILFPEGTSSDGINVLPFKS